MNAFKWQWKSPVDMFMQIESLSRDWSDVDVSINQTQRQITWTWTPWTQMNGHWHVQHVLDRRAYPYIQCIGGFYRTDNQVSPTPGIPIIKTYGFHARNVRLLGGLLGTFSTNQRYKFLQLYGLKSSCNINVLRSGSGRSLVQCAMPDVTSKLPGSWPFTILQLELRPCFKPRLWVQRRDAIFQSHEPTKPGHGAW